MLSSARPSDGRFSRIRIGEAGGFTKFGDVFAYGPEAAMAFRAIDAVISAAGFAAEQVDGYARVADRFDGNDSEALHKILPISGAELVAASEMASDSGDLGYLMVSALVDQARRSKAYRLDVTLGEADVLRLARSIIRARESQWRSLRRSMMSAYRAGSDFGTDRISTWARGGELAS